MQLVRGILSIMLSNKGDAAQELDRTVCLSRLHFRPSSHRIHIVISSDVVLKDKVICHWKDSTGLQRTRSEVRSMKNQRNRRGLEMTSWGYGISLDKE